eukprot:1137274-Pelagomonas_calceolata.AAC.3
MAHNARASQAPAHMHNRMPHNPRASGGMSSSCMRAACALSHRPAHATACCLRALSRRSSSAALLLRAPGRGLHTDARGTVTQYELASHHPNHCIAEKAAPLGKQQRAAHRRMRHSVGLGNGHEHWPVMA